MTAIVVFLVQFAYVLLLGLQSRNVNEGHYLAAAGTSIALGIFGLTLTAMIVNAALLQPSPAVLVAYVLAGPVGICAAMWLHWRLTR